MSDDTAGQSRTVLSSAAEVVPVDLVREIKAMDFDTERAPALELFFEPLEIRAALDRHVLVASLLHKFEEVLADDFLQQRSEAGFGRADGDKAASRKNHLGRISRNAQLGASKVVQVFGRRHSSYKDAGVRRHLHFHDC